MPSGTAADFYPFHLVSHTEHHCGAPRHIAASTIRARGISVVYEGETVTTSDLQLDTFVVVRTLGAEDAKVRIQTDAILSELKRLQRFGYRVHSNPKEPLNLDRRSCVLFHYDDLGAIKIIRRTKCYAAGLTICFGSDIKTFWQYVDLSDLVDIFIMPTALHTSVLASQLYKPVYTMEEAVDPICNDGQHSMKSDFMFPRRTRKRVVWFGYPESFSTGMACLQPVIAEALSLGWIDSFEIVTNMSRLTSKTLPFACSTYNQSSFAQKMTNFDYALLSHFPGDLSLNSWIKSPNKAVTSMACGVIPLASDTPSYRNLLGQLGIEHLLFDSPYALLKLLRNLNPVTDSQLIAGKEVVPRIYSMLSTERLLGRLLEICHEYLTSHMSAPDWTERARTPPSSQISGPEVGFTTHLRDLAPSALRALRRRRQ